MNQNFQIATVSINPDRNSEDQAKDWRVKYRVRVWIRKLAHHPHK
ncbi:unnamed protein product [Arabidopsis lyrata]|nr:unnamed protein product [Arabidopsis lyrata]